MTGKALAKHLATEMERLGGVLVVSRSQAERVESLGLPAVGVTIPDNAKKDLVQLSKKIVGERRARRSAGDTREADDDEELATLAALRAGFLYAVKRYADDLRNNAELTQATRKRNDAAKAATNKRLADRRAAVADSIACATNSGNDIDVDLLAAAHQCSPDTIYRDIREMNQQHKRR